MRINKKQSVIEVELDGSKIKYGSEWMDKQTYFHSKGSEKIEEWKIDLIKNYDVSINELQSKD
jgi:hypothetical protein